MGDFLKKSIWLLLLVSLVNIVTARPVGHCTRSLTLAQFVLEEIQGLPDHIPNDEEQNFRHHYFYRTAKPGITLQQQTSHHPAAATPARNTLITRPVYAVAPPGIASAGCYGYLFRLTPF